LFTALAAFCKPALSDTGLPPQLRGVSLQQRLNQQIPLDLYFRDESGKQVQLK
jgi:hypothetical protein